MLPTAGRNKPVYGRFRHKYPIKSADCFAGNAHWDGLIPAYFSIVCNISYYIDVTRGVRCHVSVHSPGSAGVSPAEIAAKMAALPGKSVGGVTAYT